MQLTTITDAPACEIFLGTVSFGSKIPESVAFEVMDAYVDAEGNVIDTAKVYSEWEPDGAGKSEETVGAWLHARGNRDQIIISTKGGHPPMDNMAQGRCKMGDIQADFDESLRRMGIDYIDLYWLHRDDPDLPVEAIIDNLAALHAQGKVGQFGASNWVPERIAAANAYAETWSLPGFICSQPGWALASRETDTSTPSPMLYLSGAMRQWHVDTGFPLAPYTAQAQGFFGAENAAWARDGFTGEAPRGAAYDSPINRKRLDLVLGLAAERFCTTNQIALAWLLHQPFPPYPLIGTKNPDHVREAMGALEVVLAKDEVEQLLQG